MNKMLKLKYYELDLWKEEIKKTKKKKKKKNKKKKNNNNRKQQTLFDISV